MGLPRGPPRRPCSKASYIAACHDQVFWTLRREEGGKKNP